MTKADAFLSLPGDLLIPQAPLVADRAVQINAKAERLSELLPVVESVYQHAWARQFELVYEQVPDVLVWRTVGDDVCGWGATLSASVDASVDGTSILRIRERFTTASRKTRQLRLMTAVVVPLQMRQVVRENLRAKR